MYTHNPHIPSLNFSSLPFLDKILINGLSFKKDDKFSYSFSIVIFFSSNVILEDFRKFFISKISFLKNSISFK
jgi:hypothetical protein